MTEQQKQHFYKSMNMVSCNFSSHFGQLVAVKDELYSFIPLLEVNNFYKCCLNKHINIVWLGMANKFELINLCIHACMYLTVGKRESK